MAYGENMTDEQARFALDWLDKNVLNHPEHGAEVKRILKKVDPRVNFPELDLEEKISTKTKELEEKTERFLKDQKAKENENFWSKEREKVKDIIPSDKQQDFEKWMVENHLGDMPRAAKLYKEEVLAASAEPTNYREHYGVGLPNSPGLFQDPRQWARDEALRAITDIRKGR
jgi:hypothetical protein